MTDPNPQDEILAQMPELFTLPKGMKFLSPQELYDSLMSAIEPELTTSQLPLLDQKYKDETPEEADARAKRYDKAYEEYDKKFLEYSLEMQKNLRVYQRQSSASFERMDRTEEENQITALESQISQS